MFEDDVIVNNKVDMAEIYRQNYMDALDEVRNLRQELAAVRYERDLLEHQLDNAENYILFNNSDEDFVSIQILKWVFISE